MTKSNRYLFQEHIAHTTLTPLGLEIQKAEGSYLYDKDGQAYLDMIGGISVCNIGHSHPKVVKAIQSQAAKYLHVMVYGEIIQGPQSQFAGLLASTLPENLQNIYFTNSGSEGIEGAMKLAKKATQRTEIIACDRSYHGSTQGAMSLFGDIEWRAAYSPLLPDINFINFNDHKDLEKITSRTACVIIEPIQAEAGIQIPDIEYMKALRNKCNETGTLLVFDENQTGFGRTGTMWAFEQFEVIPDILVLGKALGGGTPMGAFISSKPLMQHIATNPILGHMTTFGGHPLCCAAGHAALQVILEENLISKVKEKGKLFKEALAQQIDSEITIRQVGLMIAVELTSSDEALKIIQHCLTHKTQPIFIDWFLFADHCLRIVPPLNIKEEELIWAANLIATALNSRFLKKN